MTTRPNQVSAAQLYRAAAIKEKIEKLEAELASLLGKAAATISPAALTPGNTPKKRSMSAATKAKIAAKQRANWAKRHGTSAATPGKGR